MKNQVLIHCMISSEKRNVESVRLLWIKISSCFILTFLGSKQNIVCLHGIIASGFVCLSWGLNKKKDQWKKKFDWNGSLNIVSVSIWGMWASRGNNLTRSSSNRTLKELHNSCVFKLMTYFSYTTSLWCSSIYLITVLSTIG